MNVWDILIVLVIAAAVFFAVRTMRTGKKSCCSDRCSGCPCHCPAPEKRK